MVRQKFLKCDSSFSATSGTDTIKKHQKQHGFWRLQGRKGYNWMVVIMFYDASKTINER